MEKKIDNVSSFEKKNPFMSLCEVLEITPFITSSMYLKFHLLWQ